MNDTSLWLIRLISIALLACAIVRGVPEVFEGYGMTYIIAIALSATWIFAELTLRGGVHVSRPGLIVLLVSCSCALALGNSPGAVFPTLATTAVCVVLLASVASLLSGSAKTAAPRAAIVLFCASAGAAWQAAAVPLIATFVVRN